MLIKKAKFREIMGENRINYLRDAVENQLRISSFTPPYVKDRLDQGQEVTIAADAFLGIPLCLLCDKHVPVFVGEKIIGHILLSKGVIDMLKEIKEDD